MFSFFSTAFCTKMSTNPVFAVAMPTPKMKGWALGIASRRDAICAVESPPALDDNKRGYKVTNDGVMSAERR